MKSSECGNVVAAARHNFLYESNGRARHTRTLFRWHNRKDNLGGNWCQQRPRSARQQALPLNHAISTRKGWSLLEQDEDDQEM